MVFLIVGLVILNLRGVKESVSALAPIFIIFIITHILLIGYGILSHSANITPMAANSMQPSFGHINPRFPGDALYLPEGLFARRRDIYGSRSRVKRYADHAGTKSTNG